jgi:hypothetical protein
MIFFVNLPFLCACKVAVASKRKSPRADGRPHCRRFFGQASDLGPMLEFLKYFRRKNMERKMAMSSKFAAIFAGKNDHNNSFQENVQIFLPKKQIKTTTPKVDFII